MSNTPSGSPSPKKQPPKTRKTPITSVTFIVDSILVLKGDKNIVVVTGYDKDKGGKSHVISLYGPLGKAPDPQHHSIVGNLANFQVRLLAATQGADPKESERIGNIESYNGYIDNQGGFSM